MEDLMLAEILKFLQKKYLCIGEIERITREVGDSLSRNDRTSVQILLGMRQEEMDKADNCEKNIRCLLSAMTKSEEIQISEWLKGRESGKPDSPMAGKIMEKGKSIQLLLQKTIEIDRHISKRLAGNDSYYK